MGRKNSLKITITCVGKKKDKNNATKFSLGFFCLICIFKFFRERNFGLKLDETFSLTNEID